MSLPKKTQKSGGSKKSRKKSKHALRRNKPYNIDPKSVEWQKFSGSSTKSLKEGELVRRKTASGYEYGVADGGFGTRPNAIGGAIYVRTLTNMLTAKGHVLTLSNDRYLYNDIEKAGIARWHRDHDKVERVAKKIPKLVGRDKKMHKQTIAKLKAKPSVHNFQTYLIITTKARVRNIKVGKKRKDGTRMASWEQEGSDGWFKASTSYLTDEGYVDGW